MSLSIKNIKTENKLSKTINPGNVKARIYDLTLTPGYNTDSYNLVLFIETEPIDDFEGFYYDPKNPNMGRFEGQVGRIRYSQYAFESKTLPNGSVIDRDQSILKAIKVISDALNIFDTVSTVDAETIEEYIEEVKPLIVKADKYLFFCVAGKEYLNKEGYTAYDLFLPKYENKKSSIGNDMDAVIQYDEKKHIVNKVVKTQAQEVSEFDANDKSKDFDLF